MKYFFLLLLVLASFASAYALFPPGGPGSRTVPVDSAVLLLVGAASVYGAAKMRKRRNQESEL